MWDEITLADGWSDRAAPESPRLYKESPQMALKGALNRTLFARARKRVHGHLLKMLAGCRTVIDVAAGDDLFYLKLATIPTMERILLNDLDLEALRRVKIEHPKVSRICADALTLRFLRHRFDGALIKNVLHHLADQEAIAQLLRTAQSIADRVVLVEIEDPRQAGPLPRFLHKAYYRRILKEEDNESLFFSHERLCAVLTAVYPEAQLILSRIATMRGTYTCCRADWPGQKGGN